MAAIDTRRTAARLEKLRTADGRRALGLGLALRARRMSWAVLSRVPPSLGEPAWMLLNKAMITVGWGDVVPAGLLAKMSFEFVRPLRLGVRARSRGRIVDTYRRRGRGFMVTEFETVEEPSAAVLVRGRFTQMLFPDEEPIDGQSTGDAEAPC